MKISEAALIKALTDQKIEANTQKETNQVYFVLKSGDIQFPAFLRPLHDGNLLQIMVFIPVTVDEKGKTNLARFLHMANKELDMPGFGMDEASGTAFYRIIIPAMNNSIDDSLFLAYINTSRDVCTTFCAIIQALGVGAMTMDDVYAELTPKGEAKKAK